MISLHRRSLGQKSHLDWYPKISRLIGRTRKLKISLGLSGTFRLDLKELGFLEKILNLQGYMEGVESGM